MLKPSEIEATHMDSQIVSIEFQIIGGLEVYCSLKFDQLSREKQS